MFMLLTDGRKFIKTLRWCILNWHEIQTFLENLSNGSKTVTEGQTHGHTEWTYGIWKLACNQNTLNFQIRRSSGYNS
jgi:hypothetical protein